VKGLHDQKQIPPSVAWLGRDHRSSRSNRRLVPLEYSDATHSLQRDVIPGCASFASRTTGFKAIDLRIGVSYSTILCREV